MNWEKHKNENPVGFSSSRRLPVKQYIYSILRQDAPRRQPEGIVERWGVHSSAAEIGFRESKEECDVFPPPSPQPKQNGIPLFDHWENWEKKNLKNWEAWNGKDAGWETTQGKKGGENEKQQQANGTRKALLSEVQHDRKWHVECRKRKPDRYRLICWLPWKTCPSH